MSTLGLVNRAGAWTASQSRHGTTFGVLAITLAAFCLQAGIAIAQPAPWIFPDELIYSELAKGIWERGLPSIRGVVSWDYGPLYPLLISATGLSGDGSDAFLVVRLVNAAVVSLAVPLAYLFARRFVSRSSALVVALATACMPSMLYAGTILTEVALFPSLLLVLLAMVCALQHPSPGKQLLVGGALCVAVLVKPLALVLLPAWLVVIVADGALSHSGRLRLRLRAFRTTWLMTGVGVLIGALSAIAFSVSPSEALGVYSSVLEHIDAKEVPYWFLMQVAGLDLYVVVAPFAAAIFVVILGLRRGTEHPMRRYAALAVPVSGVVALATAVTATAQSELGTRALLHERVTFILAPLVFTGLALWLEQGGPRPRGYVWLLGLVVLLPCVLPLSRLRENANFQAMSLVPWLTFDGVSLWPVGVVVLGALSALLLHRSIRVGSAFVWSLILAWLVTVGIFALGSFQASSRWAWQQSGAPHPTWIDDATPPGSDVIVIWAGYGMRESSTGRERAVWVNEYFNRRVGIVYWLGTPMTYDLPAVEANLRRGVAFAGGVPIRAEYVLAVCPVTVRGQVVARGTQGRVTLYKTPREISVGVGPLTTCSD